MGKGWLTCASTKWTTHLTLRKLFRGLCGIGQFLCSSFRVCASLSPPYKMKNPLPLGQGPSSLGPNTEHLAKKGSHCRSTHVVSFPPPGGQAHPEGCSHRLPEAGQWSVNAGVVSGQEGTTGQKGQSCNPAQKPQIRVREAEGGPDSWLSGNIPAPTKGLSHLSSGSRTLPRLKPHKL